MKTEFQAYNYKVQGKCTIEVYYASLSSSILIRFLLLILFLLTFLHFLAAIYKGI